MFHSIFSPQNNLTEIVTELKTALRQRIAEKDWLDSSTKKSALLKVDSIYDLLAYPKLLDNDTFLNRYHADVRETEGAEEYRGVPG